MHLICEIHPERPRLEEESAQCDLITTAVPLRLSRARVVAMSQHDTFWNVFMKLKIPSHKASVHWISAERRITAWLAWRQSVLHLHGYRTGSMQVHASPTLFHSCLPPCPRAIKGRGGEVILQCSSSNLNPVLTFPTRGPAPYVIEKLSKNSARPQTFHRNSLSTQHYLAKPIE